MICFAHYSSYAADRHYNPKYLTFALQAQNTTSHYQLPNISFDVGSENLVVHEPQMLVGDSLYSHKLSTLNEN